MRRFAAVPALAAVLSLAFAGPASAQPYPPTAAAIQVSDPVMGCPQSFTVSGTGFVPGETVTITFDGQAIGSAIVDSQGNFSADVTSPDMSPGSYTVTATDSVSASATVACVPLSGGPAPDEPAADEAAQGGVAFTGTNLTVGLLMLVGLLVAGTLALLVDRRRHKADV